MPESDPSLLGSLTLQVALLAACGLLVLSKVFRLSLLEVIMVALPFMFYVPLAGTTNMSLADCFLPLALPALLRNRRRIASSPIVKAGFPLVMVMAISLVWNGVITPNASVVAGVAGLVKIVIGLSFAAVISLRVSDALREDNLRFINAWAWTATAIAAITISDSIGATTVLRSLQGIRSSGTFEDPNLFAAYLGLSLAVVLAPFNRVSGLTRIVQVTCLSVALLTTGSRSALLAIGLAVVFLLLATGLAGVKVRIIVAFAIATLTVVWANALVTDSLGRLRGFERVEEAFAATGDDPRLALWALAWETWTEHPLLGVGVGQFFTVSSEGVTHNTYLNFLAESGLIACAFFIAIPLIAFIGLRRTSDVTAHLLAAGLVFLAVEMYALNLQNVRFVWVYFGICLAVGYSRRAALARMPMNRSPRYARSHRP